MSTSNEDQIQQSPARNLWQGETNNENEADIVMEDNRDDFYGQTASSLLESGIFRESMHLGMKSVEKSSLYSTLSLSPAWSQDSNNDRQQDHLLESFHDQDGQPSNKNATCIYWEERIDASFDSVSKVTESTVDSSKASLQSRTRWHA
jgi:hypothetical protein